MAYYSGVTVRRSSGEVISRTKGNAAGKGTSGEIDVGLKTEPDRRTESLEAPQVDDEDIVHKTKWKIRVTALSEEGHRPIPGALVRLSPAGSGGPETEMEAFGITDIKGRVEFVLAKGGAYQVEAIDEELSSPRRAEVALVSNRLEEDLVLLFPFEPDVHFFGRLSSSGGPLPFHEAEIIALSTTNNGSRRTLIARPDGDGLFEVWAHSWRLPKAEAVVPGYSTLSFKIVNGHEVKDRALILSMSKEAKLEVTVTDVMGQRLARVVVQVSAQRGDSSPRSQPIYVRSARPGYDEKQWTQQTEADGTALFEGLPTGVELTVSLSHDDYPISTLQCNPLNVGEVRQEIWSLGATNAIAGKVVAPDGTPLEGCSVWLSVTRDYIPLSSSFLPILGRATTDEDGQFQINSTVLGQVLLGVDPHLDKRSDMPLVCLTQTVDADDRYNSQNLLIRLLPGATIEGNVQNELGLGAPGVPVVAQMDNYRGHCQAGSDGAFVLGPFPPGRYEVKALGGSLGSGRTQSLPVQVVPGDRGIVLQLRRGGAIQGSVVDSDGNPVRGFDIWILSKPGYERFETGVIGCSDSYSVGGIVPGVYDVLAGGPAVFGMAQSVIVESGGSVQADILVLPAAVLVISSELKGTTSYSVTVDDIVIIDAQKIAYGETDCRAVPEGPLHVAWEVDGENGDGLLVTAKKGAETIVVLSKR